MRVGIATDHGGFALKDHLARDLQRSGHEVVDFGAHSLVPGDDYPDYVIPLARAVASGGVERGVAICTSGVGASFTANKVRGVRAALIHDVYSAHQGVEDDNMNVLCLGARVTDEPLALEIVRAFLSALFKGEERYRRRLAKVAELEKKEGMQ